jgi:hypothetical protein
MMSDQGERMRRSNTDQLSEHSLVGDMRAMIVGTGLDLKFWPFAFDHFLRIIITSRGFARLGSGLGFDIWGVLPLMQVSHLTNRG